MVKMINSVGAIWILLTFALSKCCVYCFVSGMGGLGSGLGYGMGGMGQGVGMSQMGSRRGMMSGGMRNGQLGLVNSINSQSNNLMSHFPPGVKMIDGELIDITNKVIQKVGTPGGGTHYVSYMNPRGPPMFRRREVDTGRHYIVFPDANYLPGDGHYIVLRKVRGLNLAGQQMGAIYEAFYLDLGDSVNALVSNWNSMTYQPNLSRAGAIGVGRSAGVGAMANKMRALRGGSQGRKKRALGLTVREMHPRKPKKKTTRRKKDIVGNNSDKDPTV